MPVADVDVALQSPAPGRAQLLRSLPEDQWFDRKSVRVSAKKLAQTLAAMANADGGCVVIGLSDGRVEDVSKDPDRHNELRQASMDHLDPSLLVKTREVDVVDDAGSAAKLLVIAVESSDLVHKTTSGVTFLRVGDETRKLTEEQALELRYDKGLSNFETAPVPGANLEGELDGANLASYRRRIGASETAFQVLEDRTGTTEKRVTAAGVLLFWNKPEKYFPNAVVRVSRWQGTVRKTGRSQNLLVDDLLTGSIPRLAGKASDAIKRIQPTRRALNSVGIFDDMATVPEDAWLEGLVNALIHRSYSIGGDHIHVDVFDDRIEIFSPGRFPHVVDITDPLSVGRYARNPRIVRVCFDLRICQELGEGIKRMFDEMRAAGLVDPLYSQSERGVTLTLAAQPLNEELDARFPRGIREILGALRSQGRMSTAEIVEALAGQGVALSRPAVRNRLQALRDEGVITWHGNSARDPRAYWTIDDALDPTPAR